MLKHVETLVLLCFVHVFCYDMLWVCCIGVSPIDGTLSSCLHAVVQDKGRPPVAPAQEKLENRPGTWVVGHDRFVGSSLSENGYFIGNSPEQYDVYGQRRI